jgi:hypothetical protein
VRSGLLTALFVLPAILAPAQAAFAQAARNPAIRLDSPRAYQVIQRDAHGHASISVRGRCTGFDGRVRVRWGDGPWLRLRAGRDGAFSVRLDVAGPGQAPVQVASMSLPSVTATRAFVGVGDVYVIAGQSNASGRGRTLSVAKHPVLKAGLFGNDYRWHRLTDPVDSPVGQVDAVSRDRFAAGSVWPRVATELMAAEDVPVAFIPCARGNVTMEKWLRQSARPWSAQTLYGSMLRRVRATGGRVRAVLLLQGESDARWRVPGGTYEKRLRAFAAEVFRDVGVRVVVGQIGDLNADLYPCDSVDAIRAAEQHACDVDRNLVRGPSLYDIDLHGGWHMVHSDDQAVAAHRWAAAILRGVLGRDVPAAARIAGATYDGVVTVELSFSGGATLVAGPSGGFTVEASGKKVAVASAEVTGPATVTLTLAARPNGPLTVSLGEGRAGAGAPVPVESSPWRLPAQTALHVPVADAPSGASEALP